MSSEEGRDWINRRNMEMAKARMGDAFADYAVKLLEAKRFHTDRQEGLELLLRTFRSDNAWGASITEALSWSERHPRKTRYLYVKGLSYSLGSDRPTREMQEAAYECPRSMTGLYDVVESFVVQTGDESHVLKDIEARTLSINVLSVLVRFNNLGDGGDLESRNRLAERAFRTAAQLMTDPNESIQRSAAELKQACFETHKLHL